jgi:hypothetical protein
MAGRFMTRAILVLVVSLAFVVSAASADDGERQGSGIVPEFDDNPRHTYLPFQWMSNLATFDMMERSPLAFTNSPAPNLDTDIEQNLEMFERQERAPGVYTEFSDNKDEADVTLTHPWGGDSTHLAY